MKKKNIIYIVLFIAFLVVAYLNLSPKSYMLNLAKETGNQMERAALQDIIQSPNDDIRLQFYSNYNNSPFIFEDSYNEIRDMNPSTNLIYFTNNKDYKKFLESYDVKKIENVKIDENYKTKLPLRNKDIKEKYLSKYLKLDLPEVKEVGKDEKGYTKFNESPNLLIVICDPNTNEVINSFYIDRLFADFRPIMNKAYVGNNCRLQYDENYNQISKGNEMIVNNKQYILVDPLLESSNHKKENDHFFKPVPVRYIASFPEGNEDNEEVEKIYQENSMDTPEISKTSSL